MDKKFFIDITRFNAARNQKRYEAIKNIFPLVSDVKDADIILVLGGDGTLAEQVAKYKDYNKPFFPINGGTVGFQMQNIISEDGIIEDSILKSIFNNQFHEKIMPTIKVRAINESGDVFEDYSFGDAVVERKEARCIRFNLCIEREDQPMYCDSSEFIDGDGILMCTATGSTAYFRQITSSIIPVGTDCFGVAPMNATINKHKLNSFILDKKSGIHISLKDIDFRVPRLILDGKEVKNFIPKEVNFSISNKKIAIYHLDEYFLHNKSLSYLMS